MITSDKYNRIYNSSFLFTLRYYMDGPKKISTLSVVILQGVVGGLVNKCQSGKFFWVHPVIHPTHFNVFMGVLNILRYIMVLQYQHYLPRVVLLHPTHFNVFIDVLNILSTWWHMMSTWWHYTTNSTYQG